MKLKKIVLFSLLLMTISLAGCFTSGESKDAAQTAPPAEPTPSEQAEPEKDTHVSQLIEYADANLRTLQFVYAASGVDITYSGDQIRYGLMDFSQDGKPELVAFASGDGEDAFFKVYYNDGGSISDIYTGHTGAFEGGWQGVAKHNGEDYLFYESFSSATGMEMSLRKYNPETEKAGSGWYNALEAKQGMNEETYQLEGYYVNASSVSPEDFEAYRAEISASQLTFDDFDTIKELKKLS